MRQFTLPDGTVVSVENDGKQYMLPGGIQAAEDEPAAGATAYPHHYYAQMRA